MSRLRRTRGAHHYTTTPAGQQQAIGAGEVTLTDDGGKPIGLKALALVGAFRVSFYDLESPSVTPCAVVQVPDEGTIVVLAKGYEDRLAPHESFLCGFGRGMYQAFEHLAEVKGQQQGRPTT